MWHCPLDIVVTGGCVVIPSKKVGLGEGTSSPLYTLFLSLLPPPLVVYGLHVIIFLFAFQACATMPDFFICPWLRNPLYSFPLSSLLLLPMR